MTRSSSSDSSANSTANYSKKSSSVCDEESENSTATNKNKKDEQKSTQKVSGQGSRSIPTPKLAADELESGNGSVPRRSSRSRRCYPSECIVILLCIFGIHFLAATCILWFASRTGEYIEWNRNAVAVQCRVLDTTITVNTCTFECGCSRDSNGRTVGCSTCSRLCWYGRVYFIYNTETVYNISTSFLAADGVNTGQEALDIISQYHKG